MSRQSRMAPFDESVVLHPANSGRGASGAQERYAATGLPHTFPSGSHAAAALAGVSPVHTSRARGRPSRAFLLERGDDIGDLAGVALDPPAFYQVATIPRHDLAVLQVYVFAEQTADHLLYLLIRRPMRTLASLCTARDGQQSQPPTEHRCRETSLHLASSFGLACLEDRTMPIGSYGAVRQTAARGLTRLRSDAACGAGTPARAAGSPARARRAR